MINREEAIAAGWHPPELSGVCDREKALIKEGAQELQNALSEFCDAYQREIYSAKGMTDYATAEAYENACKLLGRTP